MIAVLDAMGFDVVIVETVGVGQDEVDVVGSAHTSVVVTVPGLGDDIQAIKAGILEIADVLVVNKADREGADRAVSDLTHMLELRGGAGASRAVEPVEIVKTVAVSGEGVDELLAAIGRHRARLAGDAGDGGVRRARARVAAQVEELVRERLADLARAAIAARGGLGPLTDEILARRQDPYGAAEEIVAAVLAARQ